MERIIGWCLWFGCNQMEIQYDLHFGCSSSPIICIRPKSRKPSHWCKYIFSYQNLNYLNHSTIQSIDRLGKPYDCFHASADILLFPSLRFLALRRLSLWLLHIPLSRDYQSSLSLFNSSNADLQQHRRLASDRLSVFVHCGGSAVVLLEQRMNGKGLACRIGMFQADTQHCSSA